MPIQLDQDYPNDIEPSWISITVKESKWLFGVVYRPPNSDATFMDKLQEAFDRIQLDFPEYEGVTIVGDFNINWNAYCTISAQLREITDSVRVQQLV